VSNVIFMDDRLSKDPAHRSGIRDRRYAIRYPFAADADVIELESGTHVSGVTSDISLGGCFICTSKPLPLRSRARLTLSYKGKGVQALVLVRIVKPRIGMGVEFVDLGPVHQEALARWIEQLRSR
jgi:c-di-GMP-binding flagellar brake protein YcgR